MSPHAVIQGPMTLPSPTPPSTSPPLSCLLHHNAVLGAHALGHRHPPPTASSHLRIQTPPYASPPLLVPAHQSAALASHALKHSSPSALSPPPLPLWRRPALSHVLGGSTHVGPPWRRLPSPPSRESLSLTMMSAASVSTSASASESTSPLDDKEAAAEGGAELEELLGRLKWDRHTGLVVAMAQNAHTGAVMMQGFADRTAVAHTLRTRNATFFSRSRKALWTKGETSNNFIRVLDVFVDCDGDSLIYWGIPDGPTCHTGETTCFFARLDADQPAPQPATTPLSSLFAVEGVIAERQQEMLQQQQQQQEGSGEVGAEGDAKSKKPSWTQKLLSDPALLCSKIREEADELCRTLEEDEGRERAASEMADLLYHSLVLLRSQGVMLEDVAAVLRKRFGRSGIEEKASRKITVPDS